MIWILLDCGHQRTQWVSCNLPAEFWCAKCGQMRKAVKVEKQEAQSIAPAYIRHCELWIERKAGGQ